MLIRFFKDLWGGLCSFHPVAYVAAFFLAGLLAIIILGATRPGQPCTQYTIHYGNYQFNVDNYSSSNNSITFQRGSTNITLVGNYAIYENNCGGE
jgi:hypothetical protein